MKTDRQRLINELDQLKTSIKDLAAREQKLAQESSILNDELANSREVSQKLITQMQSTHEAVLLSREAQLNALREQLDDKDKTIEAVKLENSQLLSKLDLQQEQQEQQQKSESLIWQAEKEQIELKNQQLNTEIDRLRVFESQIADLQQTVKDLATEKENLSTEVNTLKHFLTKANESRQQQTEELLILRKSITDLSASKDQLQSQVNNYETLNGSLQSEVAQLKTQAGELREGLESAKAKLLAADLLLNERQATIDQMNSAALQLQEAVASMRQDVQTNSDLQQMAEHLKSKLEDKDAQLSKANSLTNEYSATIEALQAKVQIMTQQSAQDIAQLQAASEIAESNRQTIEAIRAQLEEASRESSALKAQIQQKDVEISTLNSQAEKYSVEKNNLNHALQEKSSELEAVQKRVVEVEESIKEKNIELDDIRNRFGMKEAEVKESTDLLKKHKAMLKLMELKEEKEKNAHKDSLNQEMQKIEELTTSNNWLNEQLKQAAAEIATLTSQSQKFESDLKSAIESSEQQRNLSDQNIQKLKATIEALKQAQTTLEKHIADGKNAIDQLKLEKQQIELREAEHLQKIASLTVKLEELVVSPQPVPVSDLRQEEKDSLSSLETPAVVESPLEAVNIALVTENEQLRQRVDSLTTTLQQKTELVKRVVLHMSDLRQSVHSLRSEVDSSSICLRQLNEKTLFETPEFIALYTQQLEQKVNRKSKNETSTPVPNPLLQMKEKTKDGILEELHQSLNFEQLLSKFEQLTSRNPNLSSNQLLIHNLNQNPNLPSGIRVDSALNPVPTTGSNEKQLPVHKTETTDKKKKPKLKAVSTAKRATSKRSQLGLLPESSRGETAEGEQQDHHDRSVSKTANPDRQYLGKRRTSDIKKRLEADFADLKKKGTPKPIRDDGLRNLTNLTGGEIEPIILKSERKRPLEQPEPVGRIFPETSVTQKTERSLTPDESSRKKKSQ